MKQIAHRGNWNGPKPERENHPAYLQEAKDKGFAVEIDVWLYDDNWFTGHDGPLHTTSLNFLNTSGNFLHCKNLEALFYLVNHETDCDVFAHDKDDWVLTKNGFIWTFPGKELCQASIIVDNNPDWNYQGVWGVCSDYLKV